MGIVIIANGPLLPEARTPAAPPAPMGENPKGLTSDSAPPQAAPAPQPTPSAAPQYQINQNVMKNISVSGDPLDQLVWKYQQSGGTDEALFQQIWDYPVSLSNGTTVGGYATQKFIREKKDPGGATAAVQKLCMSAEDNFERYLASSLKWLGMEKLPSNVVEQNEATKKFSKYLNDIPDDIADKFRPMLDAAKGDPEKTKEVYAHMVLEAYKRGEWETSYKMDPATGQVMVDQNGVPVKEHVPDRVQKAVDWWNKTYQTIAPLIDAPRNLVLQLGGAGGKNHYLHVKMVMQDWFEKFHSQFPEDAKKYGVTPANYGANGVYRLSREMIEPWKQGITAKDVYRAMQGGAASTVSISDGGEEMGDMQLESGGQSALDRMIEQEESGVVDRVRNLDVTSAINVSMRLVSELEGRAAKIKNPKDLHALLSSQEMQIAKELVGVVREKELEEYGQDASTDDADDLERRLAAIMQRTTEFAGMAEEAVSKKELEQKMLEHTKDILTKGNPPNPAIIIDETAKFNKYLMHLTDEERQKYLERKNTLQGKTWNAATAALADMLYDPTDDPLLYQVAKAVSKFKPLAQSRIHKRYIAKENTEWLEKKWLPENMNLLQAPLPIENAMFKLTPEKRLRWALAQVTKDFIAALSDDETYTELAGKLGTGKKALSELKDQIRLARFVILASMTRAS